MNKKKTRKNRDKHSKTVAMEQTPNRQRWRHDQIFFSFLGNLHTPFTQNPFFGERKKMDLDESTSPRNPETLFFHKMATSTDSLSEGRKKDACEIPPDKGIPGIPDLCSKHECRQDDFCDRLVSRRVNRRQREESRGILPKTCANRISCWQRRKVRKTCKRELNSHEALKNNFARGNRHVKTYALDVHTETLYTYPDPVSPHIATDKVRSSRTIVGEMGMEE